MVLGKLPVPGRPAGLGSGGARAYCVCGGCGWGLFERFLLPSVISLLSPYLGDGPIKTEILSQGSLDPKQPTKCCRFSYFSYNIKYAMLEYVKQKLHDVRENKAEHVCM